MKKENLYIGVYKETNKESLFEQKNPSTYYDLKKREKVSAEIIEPASLIPYSNIIDCPSRQKRNKIKFYDLDRMKKVSLNKVFIGDLYQVTEVIGRKFLTDFQVVSQIKGKKIREKLLIKLMYGTIDIGSYAIFQDIEKGDTYEDNFLPQRGDFYIDTEADRIQLFTDVVAIPETKIEKAKLLEKYREWKTKI